MKDKEYYTKEELVWERILELSMKTPSVHSALIHFNRGEIDDFQALILIVLTQAKQIEHLTGMVEELQKWSVKPVVLPTLRPDDD